MAGTMASPNSDQQALGKSPSGSGPNAPSSRPAKTQSSETCWSADLTLLQPLPEYSSLLPISFSRQHLVVGVTDLSGQRVLVSGNSTQWNGVDTVRRLLGSNWQIAFAAPEAVSVLIDRVYQSRTGVARQAIDRIDALEIDLDVSGAEQTADLLEQGERAPVVQVVNAILFEAVMSRASDVHIQPYAEHLQIRYRIDGMLFDQLRVPKAFQEEILSRIKVVGKLNIAEKRLPQDGRATVKVGQRVIDLRIASIPTSHGERIVLRLLDKSARLYTLNELGMSARILEQFQKLIHLEHGIILVTGPTGAGKSTTLYAALGELDARKHNIVTLEDPIEYQLDGISQTQISEKKGMTFASGLRSVLRQDPDVIMVGEIRDEDTAKMAIQSALTGHLVFSTLHTNDAASAVTRLLELGIEPYLVASSVVGVLAQRLVRQTCRNCRAPLTAQRLAEATRQLDNLREVSHAFQGSGCSECRQTGYFGRVGLFELMLIDDEIRRLVQSRANASEIRAAALNHGLQLIRRDGIEKINAGMTTIDEVLRVSQANNSPLASI
jgi:general secretion pathway protein E